MIRVASVPASHLYVRHLSKPVGQQPVVRLDDPIPADGATVPGGWWPPPMLDPDWISANHDMFHVFHVHFGFDAIGTRGKPLVYAVHDLRSPHQRDPGPHRAHQDVLVDAAHELITLTAGASRVIETRWGRGKRPPRR